MLRQEPRATSYSILFSAGRRSLASRWQFSSGTPSLHRGGQFSILLRPSSFWGASAPSAARQLRLETPFHLAQDHFNLTARFAGGACVPHSRSRYAATEASCNLTGRRTESLFSIRLNKYPVPPPAPADRNAPRGTAEHAGTEPVLATQI